MSSIVDKAASILDAVEAKFTKHTPSTVPRAPFVQVDRYMGTWFVIEAIPLAPELDAYNPTETYALEADGTIATLYQFNKGSFDHPRESKSMTSEIDPDTGNAEWKVKIMGPVKAQYVISYIADDYSTAIVARDTRDHVWIMARKPDVDAGVLESLRSRVSEMGYKVEKLIRFPHRAPAQ